MTELFDQSPYTKKAFELAYAMIRIGNSVNSPHASSRLHDFAHRLLGSFTEGDYKSAGALIEEVGWFTRLWTDLDLIHRPLGESLLLELSRLKNLSMEASKAGTLPDTLEALFPTLQNRPLPPIAEKKKDRAINLPPARSIPSSVADSTEQSNTFHYESSHRQSAIVSFLREKSLNGNEDGVCRMKEIQDKFPNVSERTLRYDLQKLAEQGMIERVGAGPMSSYRFPIARRDQVVTPEPVNRYTN